VQGVHGGGDRRHTVLDWPVKGVGTGRFFGTFFSKELEYIAKEVMLAAQQFFLSGVMPKSMIQPLF